MPGRGKKEGSKTTFCTLAIVMRGLHQNTVNPHLNSSIGSIALSETTYNETNFIIH